MTWPDEFVKCRKPDCRRKVKPSVAYCCAACAYADERGFELQPHDPSLHPVHCHTQFCEQRSAERGECTRAEAVMLEQR